MQMAEGGGWGLGLDSMPQWLLDALGRARPGERDLAMPPPEPVIASPQSLTDKDLMATGRPMQPVLSPEQEEARRRYFETLRQLEASRFGG